MKQVLCFLLTALGLLAQVPTDAETRHARRTHRQAESECRNRCRHYRWQRTAATSPTGTLGANDPRPVGHDTVFEIGSTTKVFTSTILADMVRRGEVSLDDPVAKYLPPEAKIPQRGGKQITLLDLATHSSGLPNEVTIGVP